MFSNFCDVLMPVSFTKRLSTPSSLWRRVWGWSNSSILPLLITSTLSAFITVCSLKQHFINESPIQFWIFRQSNRALKVNKLVFFLEFLLDILINFLGRLLFRPLPVGKPKSLKNLQDVFYQLFVCYTRLFPQRFLWCATDFNRTNF